MNPYDFVRIDWTRSPERRKPIWHHRLISASNQKLYSGQIEVDIDAETPLFIADPRNVSFDPRKAAPSMQNKQGEYIIPGSSLKGMLRGVVEALGNGCFTLFDGEYGREKLDYKRKVASSFQHCSANTQLCIACRIFGMLSGRGVFLGKVNIGDARSYDNLVYQYDPMYTAVLVEPKPHHEAFYLDETRQYVSGRKFYFHHSRNVEPHSANGPINFNGRPANRYIQPLDYETRMRFCLDFINLEADEFAALMFALVLEENMRHKIGYGKPLGLGTIALSPTRLTLIDYAARYREGGTGKTELQGDEMWHFLYEHFDTFSPQTLAMEDLRRIWRWPPDPTVDYYYPSKRDWFDTPASRGKRIADTRNVP